MSEIIVKVSDEEIEQETQKTFDSKCVTWAPKPEYNHAFLKAQEAYANDLVFVRGHMLLNDVYDMLGFPRTSLGAVLGWTKEKKIVFGWDESVYGDEILLNFNCTQVVVNEL